ncbi:RsmD family RNA methyltransferase [Stieleria varia]|uniref:Ribosomal RNA small subunit methyltransferase D n=1 Tax=Stieleria varia TaxID=2528005 RepID=A0A5C6B473_9BACT|nr:RsmD family RNA methyltransferase [Stieleria varia]TWU06352.1 Ribosomal RNA small subunit methyltransferase D [Stieleria varia]
MSKSKPGNRGGKRPRVRDFDADSSDQSGKQRPKRPVKTTRAAKLRIISGSLRGRSIQYHGADFTRPMRDNVRENLFNILGQTVKGSVAIDLFSGTGALAIESISRGADKAIAIERSRHAAEVLKSNGETLGVSDKLLVVNGDAFRHGASFLGPPPSDNPMDDTPRVVFLCPPYALWDEALPDLLRLIETMLAHSAPGSILVAESEKHFDPDLLPAGNWDHRVYGNTRLSFIQPELTCGLQ